MDFSLEEIPQDYQLEKVPTPPSDPRKKVPEEISSFRLEPFKLPESNPGAPNSDDVKFALENEFAYGTSYDSFSKGKVTIAAPPIRGKLGPEMDNLISNLKVQNVPEDLQSAVGEAYTKTALMTKKSAIAALGFDPAKIAVEWGNRDVTVAGFYSPKVDSMYVNQHYYDTMLHESMHRGFEILRKEGTLTDKEKEFIGLNTEELAVRHLVQEHAKTEVPPLDNKTEGAHLERQGQYAFSNENIVTRERKAMLNTLEKKAADLIAKKHPGGPR